MATEDGLDEFELQVTQMLAKVEVLVRIRTLDGADVLGPTHLPTENLLESVREALLSDRPLRPRQKVTLIQGTCVLLHDADVDVTRAVALTATFAPALSDEERQSCLGQIDCMNFPDLIMAMQRWPEAARDDPVVMTAAVHKNPVFFLYASSDLKDDADLVHLAVSLTGSLLKWASERLRGNREVVEGAVKSYDTAIVFASNDLKCDPEFVGEMAKVAPNVLKFVDPDTCAEVKRRQAGDSGEHSKRQRVA